MPRLEVQLERDAYSPGETVRAWVRAVEGGGSRAGIGFLSYVERTADYTEVAWHDTRRLWDGDLARNARFELELELPADAKPGYEGDHGSLGWEVHVRSDELGRDTTVSRPFEVLAPAGGYALPPAAPPSPNAPLWRKPLLVLGPAIGAGIGYQLARLPGAIGGAALMGGGTALDWRWRARHFAVEPPRPVRRGERVRIAVRLHDAADVEGELEAELRCVERYDYRSYAGRGGPRRETGEATVCSERAPLTAVQRSAEIAVPAGAPFSHEGDCLTYRWTAIVRERRERATDRIAEHPLLVVP
jgi:hypothetical protein